MANEELRLDLSLFSGSRRKRLQSTKHSSETSSRLQNASLFVDLSSERDGETFEGDPRHFLRRIDVNRVPAVMEQDDHEEEEEAVATASSPTSTVSSLSLSVTKRGAESDLLLDEERASSRGGNGISGGNGASDEEDGSRKKLRLSKDQSAVLEESFKEHPTLNPKQKLALSNKLNLRARQVEVWFQNRRARTKLKQTEVDCEYLKKCCENLTEENRRLQRELQELRALKLSPQFYMPIPATTLTVCPSCEKLGTMAAANNNCRIPAPTITPVPIHGFKMQSW